MGGVVIGYYGYHRTSAKERNLNHGKQTIKSYCEENGIYLERIFLDEKTGKSFIRPNYKVMKNNVLKSGDTLIITELDQLGKNKQSTLNEIQYYKDNHIRLMVLQLPTTLIDYSNMDSKTETIILDSISNLMLELYSAFAHTEKVKKKEKQAQGIAKTKKQGNWDNYGRPHAMDYETFCVAYKKLLKENLKSPELIQRLGLKSATFYRYRKKFNEEFQIGVDEVC